MTIVLALLLSLIGAGAGFAVGYLIVPEPPPAAALQKPQETGEAAKPSDGHGEADGHAAAGTDATGTSGDANEEEEHIDVRAVPFPPVLTTLAAPAGNWIRLEGSALLRTETDDPPELLAETAAEQILTYLRTVRLEQIEGPSGMLALREDIDEMVKVLSGEQVQGVLIHGLVVE